MNMYVVRMTRKHTNLQHKFMISFDGGNWNKSNREAKKYTEQFTSWIRLIHVFSLAAWNRQNCFENKHSSEKTRGKITRILTTSHWQAHLLFIFFPLKTTPHIPAIPVRLAYKKKHTHCDHQKISEKYTLNLSLIFSNWSRWDEKPNRDEKNRQ